MSEELSVLNVKDKDGNWVEIPGLKGDPGESGIIVTDANNDGNVVISFPS